VTADRAVAQAVPIDSDLVATAGLVERALTRFHPSFAFEERLSRRLHAEAMDLIEVDREGLRSDRPGTSATRVLLPFPVAPRAGAPDRRARGGLLLGGAIASGVSIGAAFIAWRRGRIGMLGGGLTGLGSDAPREQVL